MAEPALLWSAADMQPREDGNYEYVPTQVFEAVAEMEKLPALARRRVQMMSATVHGNTTVGNIYIGNCVEPMDWAGENVGYIIDASNGTSNVRLSHTSGPPLESFPLSHGSKPRY